MFGSNILTKEEGGKTIDGHEANVSTIWGKVDAAYRICSLRKYQVKNGCGSRWKCQIQVFRVHQLIHANIETV